MKIDRELSSLVKEFEHVEITMPDGKRLAARIWLPKDAETKPVPAILEYIPYRKNDKTLERDHARAPWLAAQSYAYVRVDLRGTGESEGLMVDEYTPLELEDGCNVIAWIAEQSWCDGGVGIVGISWGGFNGLQIAALRPPALKAVVTICSTDDRYADDIHYMGGALLCDHLSWASVMFGINTLPPDPAHVGDRWREMWLERLDGSGLWLQNWLEHQTRDAFWKHGSVCEDFSSIQVPVYAVSGWADGYCSSVFRLVENLGSPVKGLIGPWAHKYPHLGKPGPAIDWLTEETRWWDHWLKGHHTGIMDDPKLRLFMQDHAEPSSFYEHRDGHWIAEPSWPSPNIEATPFVLGSDHRLVREGGQVPLDPLPVRSPLWVGFNGGKWCSYAKIGDQPDDQRRDDAGSLIFETEPLEAPIHIAGDPKLALTFSADSPVGQVAIRLIDVSPEGAATRVSYGVFNLTHRNSHENPERLEAGREYSVDVRLKHVAQTFRVGHRIRLSISNSYFPIIWPAPEPFELTILPAQTRFFLPIRTAELEDIPDFLPPRAAEPLDVDYVVPAKASWKVVQDRGSGRVTAKISDHEGGAHIQNHDFFHSAECSEEYSVLPNEPTSAKGEVTWRHEMSRENWSIQTVTHTILTASENDFCIKARLEAWENEELVREKEWDVRIARNLV
jgi:uncharacterized protein